MGRYVHVFLFFLLFLFLATRLSSSQLSPDQYNVMVGLSSFLNSTLWNTTSPNPCLWKGVNCTRTSPSRVTHLSLSGFGLSNSSFLAHVCTLDSLQFIDLSGNRLTSIPDSFMADCGKLAGLKLLNFSSNRLSSPLPSFSGFGALESLDFSYNLLAGGIDSQLEGLDQLRSLNLSYNLLNGSIPTGLGSAMALRELKLSHNSFSSRIPREILDYKNLTLLDLSFNSLSGSVPDSMAELAMLQILLLSSNQLKGEIPPSLSTIRTLQWFGANSNGFTGKIPQGITKYVRNLDLSYNKLGGSIPPDLLSPQNLVSVDVTSNSLEGPIPHNISRRLFRLRLGWNLLNGSIPPAIGDLSNLTYLELDGNGLNGVVPSQLGNCKNLMLLNLAANQLRGGLPGELGNLRELVVMKLHMNHIEGVIPDEFSELEKLLTLNLSRNSLTGMIPPSISRLQNLTSLNLEYNQLDGWIPSTISMLRNLRELQLGNNNLTGEIPRMPSGLATALNLSSNFFHGPIPTTLGELSELEVLDLSNNGFTGKIPRVLCDLKSLTHLVLSNNQLTGTLPEFSPFVIVNTTGNNLVNASIPDVSPKRRRKSVVVIIIVSVVIVGVGLGLAAAILVLFVARRFYRVEDETLQSGENPPQVINGCLATKGSVHKSCIDFALAMKAVGNPSNILWKTRFSTYYKSIMPSGMSYYVKKLNWGDKIFQMGSQEKFRQELEILGRLSSSNIMTPLAYVLTTDSAYLFYEHVHEGTVFDFLHRDMGDALDWQSRYSIAVGVAQGLTFLHGCNQPVLLLDLSTKSILLKSPREPQIGDIELCKVIDPSKSTGNLSTVAGSVGYIPPEYAYTMRVTMASNIYSFGVVLLELLTGKPPVSEGIELAKLALSYSSQIIEREQILDSSICDTSLAVRSQMLSVLKIALSCVGNSPKARPKARNVLRMLFNAR